MTKVSIPGLALDPYLTRPVFINIRYVFSNATKVSASGFLPHT